MTIAPAVMAVTIRPVKMELDHCERSSPSVTSTDKRLRDLVSHDGSLTAAAYGTQTGV